MFPDWSVAVGGHCLDQGAEKYSPDSTALKVLTEYQNIFMP